MKSVRLYFKKLSRARFVSHLDMNRLMIRLIRKSGLDIWYTEGFNPHPYITFALPLPLGFEGLYEIMDIRLNDDGFNIEKIPDMLNNVCPPYIQFFDVKEPINKTGKIAFADYEITFDDGGKIYENLDAFLKKDSIISLKRTKKGDMKEIDLAPKIKRYSINKLNDTVLSITLPAGPDDNINPNILFDSFFAEYSDEYYCFKVLRTAILDKDLNLFV